MKKLFKILGISLSVVLLILIATPFLFQSKIKESVKTVLNDAVHAHIDFEDVNLSLISSFPQANVSVHNLKVINLKPFEGDALATIKLMSFEMPIMELFKSSDEGPIVVNSIAIDQALIAIKSDQSGNVNYDIAKESESTSTETEVVNTGFEFNIDHYAITNSYISYHDVASKTFVELSELNHSGTAAFSNKMSELNTITETQVRLDVDSTNYLNKTSIKLDALLDLDLKKTQNIRLKTTKHLSTNYHWSLMDMLSCWMLVRK